MHAEVVRALVLSGGGRGLLIGPEWFVRSSSEGGCWMGIGLWRVSVDGRVRLARGPADEGPLEFIGCPDLDVLLARGAEALLEALTGPAVGEVPRRFTILAPVESQPVWASGVTYERSRQARKAESDMPDAYNRVYMAERPLLCLKALPGTVVAPGDPVGIRVDSCWDVPEPELVLALDSLGRIAGYCCGNDVSSRSIEGENPLYLPQANLYQHSCSLGPCLVPVGSSLAVDAMTVELQIHRNGKVVIHDQIRTAAIRRTPTELASWLFRCLAFPYGVMLMTGTGIVPDDKFTLREADVVRIAITGLGVLVNPVHRVGNALAP